MSKPERGFFVLAVFVTVVMAWTLGFRMGTEHMKRWQDEWYAEHPVVKEVPEPPDAAHMWVMADHGMDCVVLKENEPIRPNWENPACVAAQPKPKKERKCDLGKAYLAGYNDALDWVLAKIHGENPPLPAFAEQKN